MKRFSLLLLTLAVSRGADAPAVFEFHSNFWVNLHHFLFEQALVKPPVASDSKEWNAAVDYYRRDLIQYQMYEEHPLGDISQALSRVEPGQSLQDRKLPPGLVTALENAAPIYRERWWPQHNRANLAWIEDSKPLVAKYAPVLTKEIAAAYRTPWPAESVWVDVAEYASWAGAYTTRYPTHVTMTSSEASYRGSGVIEMLFHEASHALDDKVDEALNAEAKSRDRRFKARAFTHAVLFYTAGELTRRHIEGYVPFGIKYEILEKGWPGAPAVLDKDWKPYLDGEIDLAEAARRLVTDYGLSRTPTPSR